MINHWRLVPVATVLFTVIGGMIALNAPAVDVAVVLSALALVVAFAVATGVREVRVALAALPQDDDARPFSEVIGVWRHRTFFALGNSNFRMLYFGNLAQFASMQMQLVVRGWLVFHLTGSYAALGTMALANALPSLIGSPIGGVVADRATKKTVIQSAQIYNAINAALLAILAAGWFGLELQFWHLFLSAFLQGSVNSLMQPSRQSMISDLVPRDRLMNAIALNSSGQTMMQLVGPAMAGFLIAALSPSLVFVVMSLLYMLAAMFTYRLPTRPLYAYIAAPVAADAHGTSSGAGGGGRMGGRGMGGAEGGGRGRGAGSLRDLLQGLAYVVHDPTLRMVLGVNFLVVVVAMPYMQLLPGFVSEVLQKGPAEQGVLQSMQGVGALIGALFVASMPSRGRGRLLIICGTVMGLAIVAFSASTIYLLSLPIMVVLGFGQAGRQAMGQVLIQEYAEDEYRGRVVAVLFMEFGLVQFGTFFVGLLAQVVGPRIALGGLAALLVVSMALVAAFVPRMRNLD